MAISNIIVSLVVKLQFLVIIYVIILLVEVIKALPDPPALIYQKPWKKTKAKSEKDILQHLKTFFTDELTYHKSLQKINKKASKRIKKLLRKM